MCAGIKQPIEEGEGEGEGEILVASGFKLPRRRVGRLQPKSKHTMLTTE